MNNKEKPKPKKPAGKLVKVKGAKGMMARMNLR
jgi:hypothetical protein